MCCLHMPARLETLDADVSCGARICSIGLAFLQPPNVFRRLSVLQNCSLALALLPCQASGRAYEIVWMELLLDGKERMLGGQNERLQQVVAVSP